MMKSQVQQICSSTILAPRIQRHFCLPSSLHFAPRTLRPCLRATAESDSAVTTTTTTRPLEESEAPLDIFTSTPAVFATDDDPSPIQVASSVLLTGAITIFLFRSLRRRARRSKELQFRSSGAKKSIKEEAMERLTALSSSPPSPVESKGPPSPIQALLGALSAGAIAILLYKFTLTIEDALNRQVMSDNFSARQMTIAIRTMINGLCYLATFVFGINSVGLFLYAGQLAINNFMEGSTIEKTATKEEKTSTTNSPTSNTGGDNTQETQSSDDPL